MRRAFAVALTLGLALLAVSSGTAQTRLQANARLVGLISARIESQRPIRLSAETITLTGSTLRLAGGASVRFDDTYIRAEEIFVNPATAGSANWLPLTGLLARPLRQLVRYHDRTPPTTNLLRA